jgi:hypothetical protein
MDPFHPHHSRGSEPQEQLLAKLIASLADGYEPQGEPVTTMWDAGQYVKHTDEHGQVRYLRVVVQPYFPPEPGPRPQLP